MRQSGSCHEVSAENTSHTHTHTFGKVKVTLSWVFRHEFGQAAVRYKHGLKGCRRGSVYAQAPASFTVDNETNRPR